jgi:hypothetical protein
MGGKAKFFLYSGILMFVGGVVLRYMDRFLEGTLLNIAGVVFIVISQFFVE